jgi:hypothetical protein
VIIRDGICFAATDCDECAIVDAKPLVGGMILATFSNDETRLFDTTQLAEPVFAPLRHENVFNTLTVEHGFISWDNGNIDIAPEYVYENSYKYNPVDIVSAEGVTCG